MRNEIDVAWCAGFFDGEGHVSYRRSYPSKSTDRVTGTLHASIPQNSENIEVLEFFQSVIGFGRIKGPYIMPKGKTQHRLLYGVKKVEELFKILKPYLKSEKTLDFQRALTQYWTHDPTPTPDDFLRLHKKQMKKLSK
jgi:LAGLIDADG endonuclease